MICRLYGPLSNFVHPLDASGQAVHRLFLYIIFTTDKDIRLQRGKLTTVYGRSSIVYPRDAWMQAVPSVTRDRSSSV